MSVMTYSRGELAARTGCNAETIRYYEKVGVLKPPLRTESGHRRYDLESEKRLRFVMRGRELGFSLIDLQNLLDLVDRNVVSCAEVKNRTQTHLTSVRMKIRDLKRMETTLSHTLAACSGKDVPKCPMIDTLFGEASQKRRR